MQRGEVEALVDEVLRERLGSLGYRRATVVERPDESGTDSFYVDVHFEPPPPEVEGLPVLAVAGELRQRLLNRDEERFPYVHYVLPDDEAMDDELDANEV